MKNALQVVDLTPEDTDHDREVGHGHTAHGGGSETLHDRRRRAAPALAERRRAPRFPVERSVLAVPVLPDGSPDWDNRLAGVSCDLSTDGLGVALQGAQDVQAPGLVVALFEPDGSRSCVGLEVRNTKPLEDGRLLVGGRFGGYAQEILRPENLTPIFVPDKMEFSLGFPEEVLRQWARVGILAEALADRVQLCPRCGGLPTFRNGCPHCGSARLKQDRLIHHFACAHVGPVRDFETPLGLVCPKCRTRHLIVGADYEYLNGPYHCLDCNWSDTELEHVAQCLRCGLRFPGHQAQELELRGYRAHRLDPLAVLAASGAVAGVSAGAAADRRAALRIEQSASVPVRLGA
jgi:hypothetical protein